jgi:hypothetical protein
MPRFILQKHATKPGYWHCADTEHGIDVTFEQHKFNETQQVTLSDEQPFNTLEAAMVHARYLREMADWLRANHYNIAMPPMKKSNK